MGDRSGSGRSASWSPGDRGRGDQAIRGHCLGQALDECGERGSVGPVQAGVGVGSAEYGDLVAEDGQFDVLGCRCATEQCQRAEKPTEDQVEQPKRPAVIMLAADPCRSHTQADFWNPTARTVITADALHTQPAHATYLHEHGAGFVLTCKQNQPRLYAALDALPWAQVPVAVRDVGRAHGRVTTRTIQVLPAPQHWGPHYRAGRDDDLAWRRQRDAAASGNSPPVGG